LNSEKLPYGRVIIDDPPDRTRGERMEFHLVYDGGLLKPSQPGRKRPWEKHAIRGFLSSQLKNLWETHPALKTYGHKTVEIDDYDRPVCPPKPFLEHLADWHKVEGIGIIPIATEANGLVCSLDVLLLRPQFHGVMISGDIDNRLKTLIDALTKPKPGQLRKESGDPPDPNPMYCLLEDDKLITGLAVKVDRLLYSMDGNQDDTSYCPGHNCTD
jgi:hypothetical protein